MYRTSNRRSEQKNPVKTSYIFQEVQWKSYYQQVNLATIGVTDFKIIYLLNYTKGLFFSDIVISISRNNKVNNI